MGLRALPMPMTSGVEEAGEQRRVSSLAQHSAVENHKIVALCLSVQHQDPICSLAAD